MVKGNLSVELSNYVLKMKIDQASKNIPAGKITPNQAIDELYELCNKYALAVQIDFKKIFKTW